METFSGRGLQVQDVAGAGDDVLDEGDDEQEQLCLDKTKGISVHRLQSWDCPRSAGGNGSSSSGSPVGCGWIKDPGAGIGH